MKSIIYTTKTGFDFPYTLTNGIVRWDSNNRVPPQDVLQELLQAGKIFQGDYAKSLRTSEKETQAFIREMILAEDNASDDAKAEHAFELRAAFGPGKKIVNILTGKVCIS